MSQHWDNFSAEVDKYQHEYQEDGDYSQVQLRFC